MKPSLWMIKSATVLSAFLLAYLLLSHDATLSAKAQRIAENPETTTRGHSIDNGYLYLLGINARAHQDPWQTGLMRFNLIKSHRMVYQGQMNIAPVRVNFTRDAMVFPDESYDCLKDADCIARQITTHGNLSALSPNLETYRRRLLRLLSFERFHSVKGPGAIDQYPQFRTIMVGNFAELARITGEYRTRPQAAIADWLQLRQGIYRQLTVSDNLLYKNILVQLLEDQLQWLQLGLDKQWFSAEHGQHLLADFRVSPRMASLKNYMDSELPHIIEYYLSDRARRHMVERYRGKNPLIARYDWAMDMVFKPRQTINLIVEALEQQVALSELDQMDFLRQLADTNAGLAKDPYTQNSRDSQQRRIWLFAPNFVHSLKKIHRLNRQINVLRKQQPGQLAAHRAEPAPIPAG